MQKSISIFAKLYLIALYNNKTKIFGCCKWVHRHCHFSFIFPFPNWGLKSLIFLTICSTISTVAILPRQAKGILICRSNKQHTQGFVSWPCQKIGCPRIIKPESPSTYKHIHFLVGNNNFVSNSELSPSMFGKWSHVSSENIEDTANLVAFWFLLCHLRLVHETSWIFPGQCRTLVLPCLFLPLWVQMSSFKFTSKFFMILNQSSDSAT